MQMAACVSSAVAPWVTEDLVGSERFASWHSVRAQAYCKELRHSSKYVSQLLELNRFTKVPTLVARQELRLNVPTLRLSPLKGLLLYFSI